MHNTSWTTSTPRERARRPYGSPTSGWEPRMAVCRVEPRGFEPLTSVVQRRHASFPEVSRACKLPANKHIISEAVFSTFQDIHLGCCTQSSGTCRWREN